jgi:hypothetical protein
VNFRVERWRCGARWPMIGTAVEEGRGAAPGRDLTVPPFFFA